ncbi:MAG TPA: TlpA family protein disulfide reductase [Nitrososphaera sp.]|nr:TlpA family protein disulfide reductase [Nitrososphaera sp.]
MPAKIGAKAPNLHISTWVQGKPTNIEDEKGNVILVEVFQVNCPGCFLYGIPAAIDIFHKYKDQGLIVIGVATAFEDFDKNNLENLQKLVTTGEVIGETYRALAQYGQLRDGNKLPYKIPFAVGMDALKREGGNLTDSKIMDFIEANIPDYRSHSEKDRQVLIQRVKHYLTTKEYSAKTFEEYALRGTPSSILVDRKGILRSTFFGSDGFLQTAVEELINE